MDLNLALWFFTYYVLGKPFRDVIEITGTVGLKYLPEFFNWVVWNLQREGLIWLIPIPP
jgi:hypothetical protein